MGETMVRADGLVKIYKTKETEVLALQGLDLTVEEGELTALIGNSGSGKSTFLNMIGGLDRPSAGSLVVADKNLFTLSERELVAYKRDTVGFIWQNNARNLLPWMTALENIMLPMRLSKGKRKRERALELLERVGLSAKKHSLLNTLSGGEQQRIAIAIALANSPRLLLADEPTGNLDADTAREITAILKESAHTFGKCVVVVTHSGDVAKQADMILEIKRGHLNEYPRY